jgi:hypothetical protein
MGDNFGVNSDEFKNNDFFYVVFCSKPLRRCEETFDDE